MRITNIAAQTVSTRYFHTDHLGSVAVITDENGVVVERLSYDAWGKRRFASGADDPTGSITSQSSRGFTGQEELDTVALVHLNGRVYDPMVGRMISADPTVPDPMNAQAWNRYSYVGNDPLAFTDPSGFSWLSSFFHSVVNFLTHNPIIKAILQIGITAILTPFLGPLAAMIGFTGSAILGAAGAAAAFAGAAIVTGLSGGNLGQMLKAGVIAGATAFALFEVGSVTPGSANPLDHPIAYAENVAGHALVGCASSVASGGSCQSGALSAAVSAGAGPLINGQNTVVSLTANAVLGGLGSVAGGGKFANGAVTGAFGYLFNWVAHYHYNLTYDSALHAGLDEDQAKELSNKVVGIDSLPGSQDPDASFMHGMRAPGTDDADAAREIDLYKSRLWDLGSIDGLAGLLHEMQDSYSPAHEGMQEWRGMSGETSYNLLIHGAEDTFGMNARLFNNMVNQGTRLITDYDQHCDGCIKNAH
jgi:RHS repeat-associated protein